MPWCNDSPPNTARARVRLLGLSLLFLLGGCGQTGPLFLPSDAIIAPDHAK